MDRGHNLMILLINRRKTKELNNERIQVCTWWFGDLGKKQDEEIGSFGAMENSGSK